MTEKRQDYRSEKPGTLRYYLLYEYPAGMDYCKVTGAAPRHLHDTRRDRFGNYQSLRGGRPDLSAALLRRLDGVPHQRFK